MEPTKLTLLIDLCILVFGVLGIWIYNRVQSYREDKKAWKAFEARIEEMNRLYWSSVFKALADNPEFIKAISDLIIKWREDNADSHGIQK